MQLEKKRDRLKHKQKEIKQGGGNKITQKL